MDPLSELIRNIEAGKPSRKKLRMKAQNELIVRLQEQHRPRLILIAQAMFRRNSAHPTDVGVAEEIADEAISKIFKMAFDQLGIEAVGLEATTYRTAKRISSEQPVEALAEIVCHECSLNALRKWRRSRPVDEQEQALSTRETVNNLEDRIDIRNAFQGLEEEDQALLRLRHVEYWEIKRIASLSGKSTETIRKKLRLAEDKMRVLLTGDATNTRLAPSGHTRFPKSKPGKARNGVSAPSAA